MVSVPSTSQGGLEEISFTTTNSWFKSPRTTNRYTQLQTTLEPAVGIARYHYSSTTTRNGSLTSFAYDRGLVISCPFLTVAGRDVHDEMKKYLYISTGVLISTICVIILIIVGAALPPGENPKTSVVVIVLSHTHTLPPSSFALSGLIDPKTNTVRYVSDGFEDYRPLPFLCLSFLIIIVLLSVWFSYDACMHMGHLSGTRHDVQSSPRWILWGFVVASGVISTIGLGFVAVWPSGNLHLSGAGIFILFYVIMQVWMHQILHQIHPISWYVRLMEHGIISITLIGGLMFGALIIVAANSGGGSYAVSKSGSAISEYVVFFAFVGLSIHTMSLMAYIANWYHEDKKTGKWVPNNNNTTPDTPLAPIPGI